MKNRNIVSSIILFLSLLIISVSCSSQKAEWLGSIKVVDGITVVKNPKEPIYGQDVFELEEELSIGEAKGTKEYMFFLVGSIDVDDRERIYVSDLKESHIKVFNRDGKYITKIPFKFPPRLWKNNKLYTIEEDQEGYQYVKRYKVTWKY